MEENNKNSGTDQNYNPLSNRKLELEVEQLSTPYFKKTILPIIIQNLFTLLIALTSLYIIFKSNVYESREKKLQALEENIDAKTNLDKTILETYEITKKKDSLKIETNILRLQKQNLRSDSLTQIKNISSLKLQVNYLTSDKDLLNLNINNLNNEKIYLSNNINNLNSNINYLNKDIANLNSKLGFAVIENNIHLTRANPYIYSEHVRELIKVLETDSIYKYKTIDSLLKHTDQEYLKDIIYYILYAGTKDLKYKNYIFDRIPKVFEAIHSDTSHLSEEVTTSGRIDYSFKRQYYCLPYGYELIFGNNIWTKEDKIQIARIIITNFDLIKGTCAKLQILNNIGSFALDSLYKFHELDYNLYFDYLALCRNMLMNKSKDYEYESVYLDIAVFSPQLFYSLVVKNYYEYYFGKKNKNYDELWRNITEINKVLFQWNILGNKNINEFATENKFTPIKKGGFPSISNDLYNKEKEKIDSWLYGDFTRFRNNKNEFMNCYKNNKF